jgi:hypothetical protein
LTFSALKMRWTNGPRRTSPPKTSRRRWTSRLSCLLALKPPSPTFHLFPPLFRTSSHPFPSTCPSPPSTPNPPLAISISVPPHFPYPPALSRLLLFPLFSPTSPRLPPSRLLSPILTMDEPTPRRPHNHTAVVPSSAASSPPLQLAATLPPPTLPS